MTLGSWLAREEPRGRPQFGYSVLNTRLLLMSYTLSLALQAQAGTANQVPPRHILQPKAPAARTPKQRIWLICPASDNRLRHPVPVRSASVYNNNKRLPPRFLAARHRQLFCPGPEQRRRGRDHAVRQGRRPRFPPTGTSTPSTSTARSTVRATGRPPPVAGENGLLPNYLGFNMGKQVDDLKLGAVPRSG